MARAPFIIRTSSEIFTVTSKINIITLTSPSNRLPISPPLRPILLFRLSLPTNTTKAKMFRTAVLRSVFRAAPVAARAAAPRTTAVVAAGAPRFTVAPRVAAQWSVGAIRSYAASSGLGKQEVEDRIKALLQGFDKVRLLSLMEGYGCNKGWETSRLWQHVVPQHVGWAELGRPA